jgi:predicted aconitase with swiveling domain
VAEVEPMLIVGCVIAEIPLFVVKDYEGLVKNIHVINNSGYLEVRGSELLLYRRV